MPENGILNPSRILISLFHATADKLYMYKIQTNTSKITAVVISTPWKIQCYCRFVKVLIRILVFLGSFVTNLCLF